jgi:hypothetical protein
MESREPAALDEDNRNDHISETGWFRLVGKEARRGKVAMYRRIACGLILGVLGASLGCITITTGTCDCEGIPDPCGGPPLPFYPTQPPGPGAIVPPAHPAAVPTLNSIVNGGTTHQGASPVVGQTAPQGAVILNGTVLPNGTILPGGTVIQGTLPPGTIILQPSQQGR